MLGSLAVLPDTTLQHALSYCTHNDRQLSRVASRGLKEFVDKNFRGPLDNAAWKCFSDYELSPVVNEQNVILTDQTLQSLGIVFEDGDHERTLFDYDPSEAEHEAFDLELDHGDRITRQDLDTFYRG